MIADNEENNNEKIPLIEKSELNILKNTIHNQINFQNWQIIIQIPI